MNENGKRSWNAMLQWLVPVMLVILSVLAYSFNTKAVNEARNYTDWVVAEAVEAAPHYPFADGKVMEEKVANIVERFEKIEGKLDKTLEKLDKLIEQRRGY